MQCGWVWVGGGHFGATECRFLQIGRHYTYGFGGGIWVRERIYQPRMCVCMPRCMPALNRDGAPVSARSSADTHCQVYSTHSRTLANTRERLHAPPRPGYGAVSVCECVCECVRASAFARFKSIVGCARCATVLRVLCTHYVCGKVRSDT